METSWEEHPLLEELVKRLKFINPVSLSILTPLGYDLAEPIISDINVISKLTGCTINCRVVTLEWLDTMRIVVFGVFEGRLSFTGLPAGGLFRGFVEALSLASGADSGVPWSVRRGLDELEEDVHVTLLAAPACPICIPTVSTSLRLAASTRRLSLDVVNIVEKCQLFEVFKHIGVPVMIVKNRAVLPGPVRSPDTLAELLLDALKES